MNANLSIRATNRTSRLWAVVLFLATAVLNTTANAGVLDWSTVSLSGSFPNFSFSHSTLGTVSLSYSNNSELFGISTIFGGTDTLLLGNTGGESLTMSWSNPATNMNMQIWDIDTGGVASESVTFVTTASVSPFSLHPTDLWIPPALVTDGTINANSDPTNFTVMNFTDPAGFNSITYNWSLGGGGGSGGFGIGDLSAIQAVPEPSTLWLLSVGGALFAIWFAFSERRSDSAVSAFGLDL